MSSKKTKRRQHTKKFDDSIINFGHNLNSYHLLGKLLGIF